MNHDGMFTVVKAGTGREAYPTFTRLHPCRG